MSRPISHPAVSVPKRLTIGYFRQDIEEMSGRSVLDEAIAGSGRVGNLHHELEALQQALEDPSRADEMDRVLARFGEVQEEYEHLGGYAIESRTREILHGLGFDDERIDGDVGALSGGWKMRVAMARVLLGKPDLSMIINGTLAGLVAITPCAGFVGGMAPIIIWAGMFS